MAARRDRGCVRAAVGPPARAAARRAARPARARRAARPGHRAVRLWTATRLALTATDHAGGAGTAGHQALALVERPELRAGRIVLCPLPTDGPGRALNSF